MLWRDGLQAGGMALLGLILAVPPVRAGEGDWPMDRHDLLRSNHPSVRGEMRDAPRVAWRMQTGSPAGSQVTADFDRDGVPEIYAVENWRIVRKTAGGQRVWQSVPISRSFSVVAFEDLDGDGEVGASDVSFMLLSFGPCS